MKINKLIPLFAMLINYSYSQNSSNNKMSIVGPCDSLNTIYNYTYLNHGAMFNVVALKSITLDHFLANIKSGTANYHIYYKTGSFIGFEQNSSAWTFLDSANITSLNNGTTITNQATLIPIPINLTMNLGDTIGFYFTSPLIAKVFLTSTVSPWGSSYTSDSAINISVARSIYQNFGTPFSTPQVWNGTVAYCIAQASEMEEKKNEEIKMQTAIVGDILRITLVDALLTPNDNLELYLSDLTSRKILASKIRDKVSEINIAGLPSGIYFSSLCNKNKIISTAKFIKN
jgi:hypothetical protein